MRHLRHVQLRAGDADRGDQHERGDPLLLGRGHQRHQPALAVADDRQLPAVDVLALAHQPDRGAQIVCVVGQRGRLDPAAALSDAALVVAQHQEAGVGEAVGELAEDRNAEDRLVAILRAGSGDQNHRRQLTHGRLCRLRDRAGQREAVRRHADLLVVGARDRHPTRRHRCDVFARDLEILSRER